MADKKITELPFIDTLSGSLVGTNTPIQNTVIPVVLRGTTNQINIENFSKFVNAYNATTGSNTFIGNQIVTGNVNISGRLTVNEIVAQYETSSILFSTGSTKLGDQLTDKHEFTGSTNVTGSLILNGSTLGFSELNSFTASQLAVNLGISSVTGALNTTTSSFDAVFLGISSVTGSINTTTSSFNSVFLGISSVTGALNTTTSSFNSVFLGISSVTGAMNTQSSSQDLVNIQISSTTGSINTTTSSFDSVFLGISSVTGALNTTTSSFDSVFLRISSTTGSINTTTSSFDSVFLRISSTTGSINTTTSSFDLVFRGISSVTGAMNTQSSSQDLVNLGLSTATGSLIGITNGLMAFTAALDSTYATDAQLYQLYQATASIHSTTSSLNTQTGSQDIVNLGISTFTGSIRSEVGLIEAYTASLKAAAIVSSSQQITNYYKFAETASANTTFYGGLIVTDYSKFGKSGIPKAVDFQNAIAVTGSVTTQQNTIGGFVGNFYTQWDSFGSQGGDGAASVGYFVGAQNDDRKLRLTSDSDIQLNHGINKKIQITKNAISNARVELTGSLLATGSSAIVGDLVVTLGGITGSILATNGIVSASTQISNYYKFAETASANIFYGNQKIKGNLDIDNKVSITGSLIVSSSTNQLWATPEFQLYNGLGTVNFALTPNTGNQLQIQAYGTKAEILQANEPLRLLSPQLQFVKYDNTPTVVSVTGSVDVKTGGITGSILATNGVVSGSSQIEELSQIAGIEAYTSSLKNAFTIDSNNDVYFTGKITTQEVHTTYTTSSVLFQSGSTKFGNSSDDIHEFTGSKFEVFNSDTSGTMYAVVKNNRARNAAVKTTTTNGSFIAGTSIGTDSFQYQIYDEVEGTNRVTINSQGGTTLQGAVSASQTLRVSGKTQIGTSIVDTSLGSNTKLSVVGDGNVNSGASQGSLFVSAGNEGGDTGLPINMGTGGATMMLLASINTSTGTATNSATYIVRFYFDGNNAPTTTYLGGSSDFVTFGVTPTNTLAVSGSSSGNKSYAWFINKFGA